MRDVATIGLRSFVRRKGRYALTALGTVLGVAVVFAVLTSSATSSRSLDDFLEQLTGRSSVLVRAAGAFDADLPEAMVGQVAALPDVEDVAPSYSFRSAVVTGNDQQTVFVDGVELESAQRMNDYVLREGRFFEPGAPELILPADLAAFAGATVGGSLRVGTPTGIKELTLVGVLEEVGAGVAADGNIVYTSINTARALAGRDAVVRGIAVRLGEGVDPAGWIADHAGTIGPTAVLDESSEAGEQFRGFVDVIRASFTTMALTVLFIAAFLIYLTLNVVVTERAQMYGTLRALGATRRQVRRVVLSEALTLGAICTAIGLLVGLLLARLLVVLFDNMFDYRIEGLAVPASSLVVAVLLGMGVTVIAALVPARRTARLGAIAAMKGDTSTDSQLGRGWIVGILALALGIVLRRSADGVSPIGLVLVLLGSVLLVPAVLPPVASVLGRIINRLRPGIGDIAVLHLVKERSRSAYTLALTMVVLSLVLSVGTVNTSITRTADRMFDQQFGADWQLEASGVFDESFVNRATTLPGVERSTTMAYGLVKLGVDLDDEFFLITVDPESYFAMNSYLWIEGDDESARAALQQGGAALLPEAYADNEGLSRGDRVTLGTTAGPQPFEVAGIFAFGGTGGEVVVGKDDGVKLFGADRPSVVQLDMQEGVSRMTAVSTINSELRPLGTFDLDNKESAKSAVRARLDSFFGIIYVVLFVAAIVGLLGLANTLVLSVIHRFREIGVLRSLGTHRRQLRQAVRLEAMLMMGVALVLSIPLGLLQGSLMLHSTTGAVGFSADMTVPWGWLPIVAVLAAVIAVIASIGPARRAAGYEVTDALRFD